MGAVTRRKAGKDFTDVAREGFVRHLGLRKFREMEDMRATLGFDGERAALEAALFLERGPYREIWRRHWGARVVPAAALGQGPPLLRVIEEALAAALAEEERARAERGDRALEEEPEFKGFVDYETERFLRDALGEIEELG